MKSFSEFFQILVKNTTPKTIFTILGAQKTIKGMSLLTSLNYQKTIGNYYKITFTDGSHLIIIPEEHSLQYGAKSLEKISTISDTDIDDKDVLEYSNQKYQIINKNDYQFVVRKIIGGLLDVEGECLFSDYVNINDPDDFLSLGWLSYTGDRADMHTKTLKITDINIINSF